VSKMPWKEVSTMSLKEEFVLLAGQEGANIRQLCRRFGISPKTAYKWIARFNQQGSAGLANRSRRPTTSPSRTTTQLETLVLQERERHPAWGGRKLHCILSSKCPNLDIPHPNTITDILRRHGCLQGPYTPPHNSHTWHRFEHPSPNDLWQMDFKGYFSTTTQAYCYPLTVLDDHSRFSVALRACPNEQRLTVQSHLIDIFRVYGLPARITMDNGSPWGWGASWGDGASPYTPYTPYTALTVWLLRLGVGVSHSRPYHPQTQGKDERFHRTMKAELLHNRVFTDLEQCQGRFDEWRDEYNLHRPHQALDMQVPASRYKPSGVEYPEALAPIEYPAVGTEGVVAIRRVQGRGEIYYLGKEWDVSKAFRQYDVALKQTETEGVLDVYFCHHKVRSIDMRPPDPSIKSNG
jgi:transposase InsO family protein